MSKSLFNVVTMTSGAPTIKNVLAQDAEGKSALQSAIEAALAASGPGSTLQNAMELSGRPVDVSITPAVSPATDGLPKVLYTVQFRAGSGPNASSVAPVLVLSNPQTDGEVTTAAADLAVAAAVASAPTGVVANGVVFIGNVDIDATV